MNYSEFSAAAQLYAENAAVVEEVKKAFLECTRTFVSEVTKAASELVSPAKLRNYVTTANKTYWWLADDEEMPRDTFAQLWGPFDDPAIVVPGKIELWAAVPAAKEEDRARLLAVASRPELKGWCKTSSGTNYYLFLMEVAYASGTEGVPKVAEAVAAVLVALTNAFEEARRGRN